MFEMNQRFEKCHDSFNICSILRDSNEKFIAKSVTRIFLFYLLHMLKPFNT